MNGWGWFSDEPKRRSYSMSIVERWWLLKIPSLKLFSCHYNFFFIVVERICNVRRICYFFISSWLLVSSFSIFHTYSCCECAYYVRAMNTKQHVSLLFCYLIVSFVCHASCNKIVVELYFPYFSNKTTSDTR